MFEMDDLPYKPGMSPAEIEEGARREWRAELKKREAAAKRKATRAANAKRRPATTTRKQTAKAGSRPVKKLPPMRLPGEQPRDRLGRFAHKTGAILWGATKATGRAIAGTARGIKKAHKTVKRFNAGMRRRGRLAERERRIALAEREKKLGLRKKAARRRRKQ